MNVPRTRRSQFSGDPVSPKPPAATVHHPVLLHEAILSLDIKSDDIVVDATLGGAGHAREIVRLLGPKGAFIGFDLDADAIQRGQNALIDTDVPVHLIRANFRDLKKKLENIGITHVTKALFDLGWSSYQLDSGRGFSHQADEPLMMTFSKEGGPVTAAIALNTWAEESLADIIYGFGEERYSRRIAKAIVERRAHKPFTTARELAEVIMEAVPASYRHGRIHPATRTFQALRIAVNDELGSLKQGIESALEMLSEDGRIAVITFHSIEDRAVKQLFAGFERAGKGKKVTKKPIAPSPEELKENRRARSAKLRVFESRRSYGEVGTPTEASGKIKKYEKVTKNKQIQTLDIAGEI